VAAGLARPARRPPRRRWDAWRQHPRSAAAHAAQLCCPWRNTST